MVLLRYLYVVALVLWVGGLVVAGALVAPSVFGVLQAWNATEGRVLAGPGVRRSAAAPDLAVVRDGAR